MEVEEVEEAKSGIDWDHRSNIIIVFYGIVITLITDRCCFVPPGVGHRGIAGTPSSGSPHETCATMGCVAANVVCREETIKQHIQARV